MVTNSLVLGIIPSLIWLAFFMFEDRRKPEPKKLVLGVFFAGALSTALAAIPEVYIQRVFQLSESFASTVSLLFSFALIEELAKFIAVFLVMRHNKFFDEWVDGMVYMITAALGFAALENALNLLGAELIVQVMLIRGVGATLLHALASGIVGFYWMRGRLIEGLFFATILHGVFNFIILQFGGVEVYASILLLFAAMLLLHDFELLKRKDMRMVKMRRRLK